MKIVHYINQFFGGIGGEDKADEPLGFSQKAIGPARGLQQLLGNQHQIVTAVCGDNYFNSYQERVATEVVEFCRKEGAGLFIAGPAFNAGRYGQACGALCAAVKENLGIPAITGLFHGNPVLDIYKKTRIFFQQQRRPQE